MDNYIYLHLKDNLKRAVGQDIYLEDVAELSCSPEVRSKLTKLVILQVKGVGVITLSVVEVIDAVRRLIPEIPILSTGESKITIHIHEKIEHSGKSLAGLIRAVITSLLLFIGSGIALMYFHEDVNMHKVHDAIYTAVTGQVATGSYWISIPYSIGLGLGIALFFGLLPDKNKYSKPDLLEIGIHKYKDQINSYLSTKGGSNQKKP
ncbi:MAG: hypothetical protein GX340_01215 [Clostridiales bacterium]|nr:hypothetical protein [Clostridiales bacterium]